MDNPSDIDCYLGLKRLSECSDLAIPTLREHLKDIRNPLPHFKVKGKILVKKSEFDQWIEPFRVGDSEELNRIVDDALDSLRG